MFYHFWDTVFELFWPAYYVFLACVVIFWIGNLLQRFQRVSVWRQIGLLLFAPYLTVMLILTLQPYWWAPTFDIRLWEWSLRPNFSPWTMRAAHLYILLFLPLGAFLKALWPKRKPLAVGIGVVVALELLGLPMGHILDVMDILFGALGVGIGWLIGSQIRYFRDNYEIRICRRRPAKRKEYGDDASSDAGTAPEEPPLEWMYLDVDPASAESSADWNYGHYDAVPPDATVHRVYIDQNRVETESSAASAESASQED